jgi:hypothetical protein
MTHLPLSPYSRLPAELAFILLLAFPLFALVAALSHCLCSESPYLSIKLYHLYVCYTNITLYIAFGIICGRSWNVLPVDTRAHLYITDLPFKLSPFAFCFCRLRCQCVRGGIQDIPDWCCHLYSSCGSAKHRSHQSKM